MKNEIMKPKTPFLYAFTLALLIDVAGVSSGFSQVRYVAQPGGSKIKMEGTSTIHDWTMESPSIGGFLEVDPKFPDSALTDSKAAKPNVRVIMLVRSFKSYSATMDDKMCEAMKESEFKRIEYKLIELKPKSTAGATGSLQFDAVGTLAIAGITRTNTMSVTFEKLEDKRLKVTGVANLKMTDFGIQPPAPSILGMSPIKSGDDVKISFEWLTTMKNKPSDGQTP